MAPPDRLVGHLFGKDRIELIDLIGEGAYGYVYQGIMHDSDAPRQCAVKVIPRSNLDTSRLAMQRREILLHQQVSDGQGIVSFYETFEQYGYQFIVMQYCPEGDLWDAIASGKYVEKDGLIRDTFTQILEAVEYCHSKRVFHRDLKPENILLANGGSKVLLADFGLACGSPMSNETHCGSAWYMSPECCGDEPLESRYATAPNDVWALGVLLINLICGRHAPWKQATHKDVFFRDFVEQPDILRLLLPMSPEVHDLLGRVFVVNPSARISLQDFRLTVQRIKRFTIPPEMREEFCYSQRAAWNAVIKRPPSHPLSLEAIQLVPVMSVLPHTLFAEGVDITDGISRSYFEPFVQQSSVSPPPSNSILCEIPITNTRPKAVSAALVGPFQRQPSSSRLSADSEGPVTPDMPPTVIHLKIPEIVEASRDISDPLDYSPPKIHAGPANDRLSFPVQPFQNFLRVIRWL